MKSMRWSLFGVGLGLLTNSCAEQKFKAGVKSGAVDPIVNVDQSNENAIPDPQVKKEEEVAKPETKDTFNECDKFSNAKIVADLYPSSESKFYELHQKPLKEMAFGSPEKTFCMTNLDIPLRNFAEGFPGYPDLKSWFILDIRFRLTAPSAGEYTILIDSDDGSIVSVNGSDIIDVDGLRDGNKKIYESRKVPLEKGDNDIRVRYMQGPGPDLALQLKWQKPGDTAASVIPEANIKQPL